MIRKFFLLPIATLWKAIYWARRKLYEWEVFQSYKADVPVISVGNISFGGTGKTPFIIWLIDFFNSLDKKVLVLTRGYKGKLENSSGIINAEQKMKSEANIYGDEPLLISRYLKKGAIAIGKNRVKNLIQYFKTVQPDVILLDDGFQHLKLKRDFDLLLFDATLPLSQYQTAPLGYLREDMAALKHANALFINRSDQVTPETLSEIRKFISRYSVEDSTIGYSFYQIKGIYNSHDTEIAIDSMKEHQCVAITGIANPESFYKQIEDLGLNIEKKYTFPDHYYFSPSEIQSLAQECRREGKYIVCSEKDIVKLRNLIYYEKLVYLKIEVAFKDGCEELKTKLKEILC
ncbi:MAG: tetraacyldisaccharide 4'-kinase [Halobacteriovoraceae bacterium]|nr:tetraacyldisaccharide 4'-kinase [Halobacteriovoraceae bacterium]MCB9095475.1 tetraacyldisaccharide 4'-kinase [Halobacteriovoraceae bacterium]